MPYTPFGDKSPWESSSAHAQRVREKEKDEEKLRRLKIILEQSKNQANFFDTPEVQSLRSQIRNEQQFQNNKYRGALSGITGVFSGDQTGAVSPIQMQEEAQLPEDDGLNLNPFSHLGKGIMKGLEGWQKATEWTAGQIATPFSQQVRRNRSLGLGAGEAWRRAEFATHRFGKPKEEEGFGFNVGVKGAVELLVDPVGWATMALPIGTLMRPVGKGISTMASAMPGIKQVRKAGKEILKEGKKIDIMVKDTNLWSLNKAAISNAIANPGKVPGYGIGKAFGRKIEGFEKTGEFHKITQAKRQAFVKAANKVRNKRIEELKLQGFSGPEIKAVLKGKPTKFNLVEAKNGNIIDLDSISNTHTQNFDVFNPTNYDGMLEQHGFNQEGLIKDFVRYSYSEKGRNAKSIFSPFWLAVRNTHKLWNPGYTHGSTAHGRAVLSHAYDMSLSDSQITSNLNYFVNNPAENIFKDMKQFETKVTKGQLTMNQKHSTVTAIIRRERVMGRGLPGVKRKLGKEALQRQEVELRLSAPMENGSLLGYDVNGAPRFILTPKQVYNEYTDDIVAKSGLDNSKDIQDLRGGLINGSDRWQHKMQADDPTVAIHSEKAFRHNMMEFDAHEIDLTAITLPVAMGSTALGKRSAGQLLRQEFMPEARKALRKLTEVENKLSITKQGADYDDLLRQRKDLLNQINRTLGEMTDKAFDKKFLTQEINNQELWNQLDPIEIEKLHGHYFRPFGANVDSTIPGFGDARKANPNKGQVINQEDIIPIVEMSETKKAVHGAELGARYIRKKSKGDKTRPHIQINRQALRKKFDEKAWTRPTQYKDGSSITPLREDLFQTYDEWEEFALAHEFAHHKLGTKPKSMTMGDWENKINNEALSNFQNWELTGEVPTTKIISGFQKNVDQAAIEVADELGMNIGGNVIKGAGRVSEGADSLLFNQWKNRKVWKELERAPNLAQAYRARTIANVREADATVAFYSAAEQKTSKGYNLARNEAQRVANERGIPVEDIFIVIDPTTSVHQITKHANELTPEGVMFKEWLSKNNVRTLNVAGPRPKKIGADKYSNEMGEAAKLFLKKTFAKRGMGASRKTDIKQKGFSNLDQLKEAAGHSSTRYPGQPYPPQGGRPGVPIHDAKTAGSMINLLDKGLERNTLFTAKQSQRKIDDFQKYLFEGAEDSDSIEAYNALMRNLHRTLKDENITSGLSRTSFPKADYDSIAWRNSDGKFKHHHFGNSYMARAAEYAEMTSDEIAKKIKPADFKNWKNLKKMGIIAPEEVAKLEQKYDLGADEVVMEFADFLDIGGYVVDWNGPMQKPVRLYDEFFDLTVEQKNWLSQYYRMFDEGAAMLRNEGIPVSNIMDDTTGNYVHHMVKEFAEFDELVMEQTKSNLTGSSLSPSAILKKRVFENVLEAIEDRGYEYLQNPTIMLEAFLRGAHKEVANANLGRRLKTVSEKELKGAGLVLDDLKNIKQQAKDIAKELKKLETMKAVPNLLVAGQADEFFEILDNVAAEMKGIDNKLYKSTRARAEDVFNTTGGEQGKQEAVQLLNDYFESQLATKGRDLDTIKSKIETWFNTNTVSSKTETMKNWRGIYGEEKVQYRAVRDLRKQQPFINEVKTLREQNIFLSDKTAKAVEKQLGLDKETVMDNFFKKASTGNDMLRLIQTGFDAGTTFLHGLPTMMRGIASIPEAAITGGVRTDAGKMSGNPYLRAWADGTKAMFKYIISGSKAPELHAKFIGSKRENFKLMAQYGVLISNAGNDYFNAAKRGTIFNRLLTEGRVNLRQDKGAIPGFKNIIDPLAQKGKPVLEGFQSSFEAYGDILREGLWDAHYNQIIRSNVDQSVKEQQLRQLADYVNGMTGAFSSQRAGITAKRSNIERSVIFFSPSYTRATVGLVGSVLNGNLQGAEARKAVRSMMGVGVGMHLAQANLNAIVRGEDWEDHVHLDPTRGDFLTTKVGDSNIGFGSAWMSLARLFAKVASDPAFRGDVLDSPLLLTGSGRGKDGFDDQGIKDYLANNQLAYWLRSRSSPLGSTMWDVGMSANFAGEDIAGFPDWFQEMGSQALPFWGQSLIQDGSVISSGSDFVGLRSTPISEWEKRRELQNGLAQQYFDTSWRNLSSVQQRFLRESPDLDTDKNRQRLLEVNDLVKEKRRVVGGSSLDRDIEQRQDEVEDARDLYMAQVRQAEVRLRDGDLSLEQYMKMEQGARGDYGSSLQTLESKYENVEHYFDSLKGKMGEFERIEDFAADKYAEIYFNEDWDFGYMYDFAAREEAIDQWRQQWGEEFEDYAVEKLFGTRWDATKFNYEFYRNRHELFPQYYEDTRKQVFDVRYNGQLNDIYQQWYKAKWDDLKQRQIRRNNPAFDTALNEWDKLREELRRRRQDLDAFLYRWGYTETLLHPWNTGREEELKSKFPFETYVPKQRVAGE